MMFDLSDRQYNGIVDILSKYPEIEEAVIFGSRADGTNKEASDIDIAIKCSDPGTGLLGSLLSDFEDSSLPFFVDIVDYNKSNNDLLKSHIDKYGIVFYQRKPA